MDWDSFDLDPLADALRTGTTAPDAEKMIWAFERALEAARVDPELLEHLLGAAACLIAGSQGRSPRDVFEQFFRRSVTDEEWRRRYEHLLAG
jgi:hypothetical protein